MVLFDALRPADDPLSRTCLVSQALRLRWLVLEHIRNGDKWRARQDFRALQGVVACLRGRTDFTLDDRRLMELCVREAELAITTCRVRL
jgi:hypothetical protein